ncbi:16S rRNA (guanine(966)-N(2))-methyltransferase RsmD [Candidatus Spongiihabitans sp.]|uniref:16S rRNA (guanine(966)-N(2))-methyltransferase RsmD n=1 Tax=Candidatus Spongiihabitans sp. TaxID=3101308 RepID=UPI003C7ACA63
MKKPRQVRIIAGQWRRRRIRFPESNDLRPSPDAVRETLFNWLSNDLVGSVCLDLYAGSGAFGFEAASRGASSVVMVESHGPAIKHLSETQNLLNAHSVIEGVIEIRHEKALHYLESAAQKFARKFDIVFIDPPFKEMNAGEICQSLITHNRLNNGALIYIESRAKKSPANSPLPIPPTWHIIRECQRGMVQSTLIKT